MSLWTHRKCTHMEHSRISACKRWTPKGSQTHHSHPHHRSTWFRPTCALAWPGARCSAPCLREEGLSPSDPPAAHACCWVCDRDSNTTDCRKFTWWTASHMVAMTPPPILLLHHSIGRRGDGWLKTQCSSFLTLFLLLSLSFHPFHFVSPSNPSASYLYIFEMMSSYIGLPTKWLESDES